MIEIFNLQIFGTDVEWFTSLSMCDKVKYVAKYSLVKDEQRIKDELVNIKKFKDCKCLNCGKNANISKGDANEVDLSSESNVATEPSKGNSTKRPKYAKRGKD